MSTQIETNQVTLLSGSDYEKLTKEVLIKAINDNTFSASKIVRVLEEDAKRSNKDLNRIVSAANKCGDFLILGPRHWDSTMHQQYKLLEKHLGENLPRPEEFKQGFIDRYGIFLTREEAWKVALAAGQIIFRCGGDEANGGRLYSENLY